MKVAQALDDGRFVVFGDLCGDQFHHVGTADIDSAAFDACVGGLWHDAALVAQPYQFTNKEK
jgi:hypothetical protein